LPTEIAVAAFFAAGRKFRPEIIDFLLGVAVHDKRDRFCELEQQSAVECHEVLAVELKLNRHYRPRRPAGWRGGLLGFVIKPKERRDSLRHSVLTHGFSSVMRHCLISALRPDTMFGLELLGKILRLEDLTNLDFPLFARHGIWTALDPFDRFLQRLTLPQPKTRDQFLGFRKGTIGHVSFLA